jgi:hypothetical protein
MSRAQKQKDHQSKPLSAISLVLDYMHCMKCGSNGHSTDVLHISCNLRHKALHYREESPFQNNDLWICLDCIKSLFPETDD